MAITNSQQAKQIIQKNKKIKGQDHMLAYITPNEAEKLMTLGGREVMTKEGIPAYPEWDNYGVSKSDFEKGDFSKSTDKTVRDLATGKTGVSASELAKRNEAERKEAERKEAEKKERIKNAKARTKAKKISDKKKFAMINYIDKNLQKNPHIDAEEIVGMLESQFQQGTNPDGTKSFNFEGPAIDTGFQAGTKYNMPTETQLGPFNLNDKKIAGVNKGDPLGTKYIDSTPDFSTIVTAPLITKFTGLGKPNYNTLLSTFNRMETLGNIETKDDLDEYYDDIRKRHETVGGDGPNDPCQGPNPPAYCFSGIRSTAPETTTPVVEESATPWRLMNKGGIVRTGFNMGGAQFTSGENISPGTSSTGGVRDDNPFTGGNGGGGGGSGDSGNVTPVVVTPKKVIVPEKSMKEKFFDLINFGDDEETTDLDLKETRPADEIQLGTGLVENTRQNLLDNRKKAEDINERFAFLKADGGRANFMGGGDTSLQAGAPELRLQGDVQPKENMMMASNDPMLEEEYEKYVFEMIEQGLEPMSFEQFRAQALSGMAEGGIAGLRQGYIIGGIVKAAKKAVKGVTKTLKKISKSKLGKAALLGAGIYGLGGGTFFGKSFPGLATSGGFGFGNLKPNILNYLVGTKGSPGTITSGLFGKGGELSGMGKAALYGIGSLGLTKLFGQPEEDEDEDYRGEGLDIAGIRRNPYLAMQRSGNPYRLMAKGGKAEPVAKEVMPLLDMGGMEKDYRANGGFVPIGRMEKADDVPARLSKNEFVFTAEAVRNAGEGDIDKGSEVMYNMMKNLEAGGDVSEESQGLDGAREMFQTSQKLEGVM
jgi:hypothetical protein